MPAVFFFENSDMASSSKSDADTPSSARTASDAGEKKSRRPRPRTRAAKPAEEKVAKPVKTRARRGAVPKGDQTEMLPMVESSPQRL